MPSGSEPFFFSGFSLAREATLFSDLLDPTPFCISGFSYGAIRAFEYARTSHTRIDKLQLFSPAFFQNKEPKYKRQQLLFFQKDRKRYIDNFLKNCAFPAKTDLTSYVQEGTSGELKALLEYEWLPESLQSLQKKGTTLEIHLGRHDRIIDAEAARAFFKPYATVYYYNHCGHLLKGSIHES
jgi:hypothetical protein